MIEREHAFNFKGEKLTAKFPNVGQLIDMESLKQGLTANRYGTMAASGVKSMYFALDLVDAIVFLQVMCPRVGRIMEVKNFTEMNPIDAKELITVYKEQILPWYSEVLNELYSIDNNGEKADDAGTSE